MNKIELAKQYRIHQYIDFGDSNERAEQQIEQAFIDGYDKALNLFNVSYCANQMKNVLCNEFTNEAKKHVGKKINKVPNLVEMLKAIEIVEKYCS